MLFNYISNWNIFSLANLYELKVNSAPGKSNEYHFCVSSNKGRIAKYQIVALGGPVILNILNFLTGRTSQIFDKGVYIYFATFFCVIFIIGSQHYHMTHDIVTFFNHLSLLDVKSLNRQCRRLLNADNFPSLRMVVCNRLLMIGCQNISVFGAIASAILPAAPWNYLQYFYMQTCSNLTVWFDVSVRFLICLFHYIILKNVSNIICFSIILNLFVPTYSMRILLELSKR